MKNENYIVTDHDNFKQILLVFFLVYADWTRFSNKSNKERKP